MLGLCYKFTGGGGGVVVVVALAAAAAAAVAFAIIVKLNIFLFVFITASLSHHALSTQPQQLLGQPQVAPQLILTNTALNQNQSGTLPVQQLLIPVSAANGTQQLLSLPISLAAGAGGQIQLLTASSGQLLATNLANLVQPNVVAMTNAGTMFILSP